MGSASRATRGVKLAVVPEKLDLLEEEGLDADRLPSPAGDGERGAQHEPASRRGEVSRAALGPQPLGLSIHPQLEVSLHGAAPHVFARALLGQPLGLLARDLFLQRGELFAGVFPLWS